MDILLSAVIILPLMLVFLMALMAAFAEQRETKELHQRMREACRAKERTQNGHQV